MSFYIRWEQNYIQKYIAWCAHILMSWLGQESTERRNTSFLKETVYNEDLLKAVLNKTMTMQE